MSLLMAAVAAHVWLVRAPGREVLLREPRLVDASASARPIVSSISRAAPAGTAVRVTTTLISAAVVSEGRSPHSADPESVPVVGAQLSPPLPIAPGGTPAVSSRDSLAGSPPDRVPSERRLDFDIDPVRVPLQTLDRTDRESDSSWFGSLSPLPPARRSSAGHLVMAVAARNAPSEREAQEQGVRDVLDRYANAFERLDVQAAKAVRPTLDDRALQRAFEQLDEQQVRFASCSFSINERDANARCLGSATYRPKVGRRVVRVTGREWTFNLSKDEGHWQIVDARIQE